MKSTLFLDPYEKGMVKGMEKGMEEGIEKGRISTLTSTLIKLMINRFGALPKEIKDLIHSADADSLDTAIDHVWGFKKLEDVKHYLGEGS